MTNFLLSESNVDWNFRRRFESQAKAQADAEVEARRKNAEEQTVSSAMKHLLTYVVTGSREFL